MSFSFQRALFISLFILFAHSSSENGEGNRQGVQAVPNENIGLCVIQGPTGVGMIRLFTQPPDIPGYTLNMLAYTAPTDLVASFANGSARIGILPPNLAALHRLARGLKVAAVNGEGMLSMLTSDPAIRTLEDVRGKTVEVAGQNASPDLIFRRLLYSRGLVPGSDLKLSYALEYPAIAQALAKRQISTAVLPEPFATTARLGNPFLRDVVDVQAEWRRFGGAGNYPITVIVYNKDYFTGKESVLAQLLNAIREAIHWTRENPVDAGRLVEAQWPSFKAAVIARAIPRSNYVYVPARDARPSLEALYRTYMEFSPALIGNAIPPDDFYME